MIFNLYNYKRHPMYKKINIFFALISIQSIAPSVQVTDFSRVYKASVDRVEYPKTIAQLRSIVTKSDKPIAIAGGKYSMGGQVWRKGGVVIDMQHLKAITAFNPEKKIITVQAGARWHDIQQFLLSHELTIMVMQSYNNFSVGGSLSVNVHGRDPHGQIIETVESITVMLADGSLVKASRTKNSDLFSAIIGGYGACGIIINATLRLEDNYKIKRVMTTVPANKFVQFYQCTIANDPKIALFNANLYGPHFNKAINFAWYKTDEEPTITDLSREYNEKPGMVEPYLEYAVGKFALAQKLRFFLEDNFTKKKHYVVWRSHEMSYSVNSLTPGSAKVTKILQEYFIPIKKFNFFLRAMKRIFIKNDVRVINISIRHVPKNTESVMSYAPKESFAFVCYIAIDNTPEGHQWAQKWTQKLINAASRANGTYYLPYHLFAEPKQFMKAYPFYPTFLAIKKKYDPQNKFQNSLTMKYILSGSRSNKKLCN